jgi:tetratricopeptide (TPR) repeat protein
MLAAAAWACAQAQTPGSWVVARSSHFEVYSQAGEDSARSALRWFEQLRGLLAKQTGLKLDGWQPVRVIGFRSVKEYEPFRLRPAAAAYSIGTESREYVVMPSLGGGEFAMAAHEYAHVALHSSGLHLPVWLSEGLADLFSTVRIGERGSTIGSDLPQRMQELRRGGWIPLGALMSGAAESPLFYAESWAVTEMLARSPEYGWGFTRLIASLAGGADGPRTVASVYGRTLDAIERDARAWAGRRHLAATGLPGVTVDDAAVEVSAVPAFAARAMIADLLMASGALERAEAEYRALAKEKPEAADVAAALGTLALARHDPAGARREWKRAIALGVADPALCYRYAILADNANLGAGEIRPALERALELKPEYDDARYQLALLEKNAGREAVAVKHLRAMRAVAPARAFSYWSALSDALNQAGERDEAKAAAQKAAGLAATPEEREEAARLAWAAASELAVRVARDADGKAHMVMVRVPREITDWNPFIEAGDHVKRVSGTLREVDCANPVTRFLVDTAQGPVTVAIPDPSRMLVRNAPGEFTCGPQAAAEVTVVYAAGPAGGVQADGVLRGIEFK